MKRFKLAQTANRYEIDCSLSHLTRSVEQLDITGLKYFKMLPQRFASLITHLPLIFPSNDFSHVADLRKIVSS